MLSFLARDNNNDDKFNTSRMKRRSRRAVFANDRFVIVFDN